MTSQTPSNPSIMAVFAHPDDETFLVGGTLARYSRQGIKVNLLCLTQGEGGVTGEVFGESEPTLEQVAWKRWQELRQACGVLGAQLLPCPAFPDGGLGAAGVAQLAQVIGRAFLTYRPDIVLTFGPDGLTGHPDHLMIHHATTLAFQQAALPNMSLFYGSLADEVVAGLSTRLEGSLDELPLELTGQPRANLTTAIDIRSTSGYKWAALACHRTQQGGFTSLTEQDRQLLSRQEFFSLTGLAGELLSPFANIRPASDLFEAVRLAQGSHLLALAS